MNPNADFNSLTNTAKIISRSDIDLMAPVGSFETLHAAIEGGADSVYFGIEKLNMRARSSVNFTQKDLEKIVRISRHFNRKTYLTLNVVVFDKEIEQVRGIVDIAKKHGINAIIAADPSVFQYARSVGMEVHLSTQLNITNIEAIKLFSQYADVAVLARELSLDQINEIASGIIREGIIGPSGMPMKLELFIHGALCMSVSGKCYLSLHHHNQSANRGSCLQDCRKAYTVREKETGFELNIENEYIMSPKDLCTIHFLDKIIASGVRVLKIEGRARSPEYVKTVTTCYNEAIHAIIGNNYNHEKINDWKNRLNTVFNRGFWDGYYLGQKLGEWSCVYGSEGLKRKHYVAKNLNYYHKLSVGEFLCEAEHVKIGDEILIIGPNTGVIETKISELHGDNGPIIEAKPGDRFSIPLKRKVRKADKLYKMVHNKLSVNDL
jgi:putative protease